MNEYVYMYSCAGMRCGKGGIRPIDGPLHPSIHTCKNLKLIYNHIAKMLKEKSPIVIR